MQKVRVGVVGVGYLGQHHARIFSDLQDCSLQAVVDIDPARAELIAQRTGCKAYTDYHDILGKVDAVSIVVPTRDHYQVARTFLEHGKDVLIEKPITDSAAEAQELVRFATERNMILAVGHLERYNAGVTRLQQIVSQPYFIECQRLAPFVSRSTDINVVLDLMIHDLDIILSIVADKRVRMIRAIGHPVFTSSIDMASAWIEFADGCVASITSSRVSKEKVRKLRVFQPDCYLSLDYATQHLTVANRLPPPDGKGMPQVVEERPTLKKVEPLRAELDEFVTSVRHRTQPRVTGRNGLEALELATRVTDAIQPKIRALNLALPKAWSSPSSL
jgi:predicted dehydrogenase